MPSPTRSGEAAVDAGTVSGEASKSPPLHVPWEFRTKRRSLRPRRWPGVLLRRAAWFAGALSPPATPRLGQGVADDLREGLLLIGQAADLVDWIRIWGYASWLGTHGGTPSFRAGLLRPL